MSELHRFEIDQSDSPPDRWWKRNVNRLLIALITNPHLQVGERNSVINFPDVPVPRGKAGSTTIPRGAFYNRYTDGDGSTWLQGGQVKSGSGNFSIADLKVVDFTDGPINSPGDLLVLEVTVDGYKVDGVLLSGLTATAASYIYLTGVGISDDTLPTISATTGRKVYIEIGRWTDSSFLPAEGGNILISFCPGAYQIKRF